MLLWIIFNVAEFTKRNPITVILLKLDMFSILILSIADTKSKFGFFTLYVTSHTRDAFHYPIILGFLRSDILTIRTPSVRSAIKIMLGSEMLCIIELAQLVFKVLIGLKLMISETSTIVILSVFSKNIILGFVLLQQIVFAF